MLEVLHVNDMGGPWCSARPVPAYLSDEEGEAIAESINRVYTAIMP
jgi:hypothetical protein